MADSQKLMALKKAYAEIILNTAKEAAARIMVSERKALRYHQELITAKDEALCMLLRLKHMCDSKVREAEIASLNQQMKIEELEAQLHEAEDIVKDLREELVQVQAELEKVTKNRMQSPEEPNLRFVSHVPEESSYAHKSDFASTVIRSKEPELFRNGCTQRIRACERNMLKEESSLSGQVDDVKSETTVRREVCKEMCEKPTLEVDERGVEKNSDIFETIREYEDNVLIQAVKSFRGKKKRANRCKKRKAPSVSCIPDQVTEMLQVSDPFSSKTTSCSVSNGHHSSDNSYKTEIEGQKDPNSSKESELWSETPETMAQLEHVEASKNDAEELTTKPESARREISYAEDSEVLRNKIDVAAVNLPVAVSDAKASDLTGGLPSQPADNRFLKYTFQRKRKREPLNSSEGNSSVDNSTSKVNTADKQNGSVETTQTSSPVTESSRQSRRLAQVARQLISLSGKKW